MDTERSLLLQDKASLFFPRTALRVCLLLHLRILCAKMEGDSRATGLQNCPHGGGRTERGQGRHLHPLHQCPSSTLLLPLHPSKHQLSYLTQRRPGAAADLQTWGSEALALMAHAQAPP